MSNIKIAFKINKLFLILILIISYNVFGKGKSINNETGYFEKFTLININNISSWVGNNGSMDINQGGSSGMLFPWNSYKAAVFKSGLIFGGKVNNEIRVGGSTYNQGFTGGRILDSGEPENINLPHVRIYRVRRDYKTAVKFKEAYNQGVTEEEIFLKYQKDWNEWPAVYGAPFEDLNNNNIYEPEIDIPGISGADQTIWYVANDLDSSRTKTLYGSLPIGIEMQVTVWAYNVNSFLNNVVFRKYVLINKSDSNVDDMYLCQWSDPDVGNAVDDLVGCDTLLNLGYAYNADEIDATYGKVSPAVGYQFLELPDSGDKKMNSFGYFTNIHFEDEPKLNDYKNGTLKWYNLFQGLDANTGESFVSPEEFGGKETKYFVPGNPFLNEGWLDKVSESGDRRFYMSAGPYEFNAGDTMAVTIAVIGAMGKNRINSVRILKYYSELLKNNYSDLSPFIYRFFPNDIIFEQDPYSAIDEIELKWNNGIENFHSEGFEFQGYNLYQLYDNTNFKENSELLKVFDKTDGVKELEGIIMNPVTGMPENGIIQFGSDAGISNKIKISKDYINNVNLIKGKKYYYGISSYLYNKQLNKTIESPISLISLVYQDSLAGPSFNQKIQTEFIAGTGLLNSEVFVADPAALTGHSYKINLSQSGNEFKWNLYDSDLGSYVLTGQNLSKIYRFTTPVIADGLEIYVYEYYPEIEAIVEIKYGDQYIPESKWDYPGGNLIWRNTPYNYNSDNDRYKIRTYLSYNIAGYPEGSNYAGCDFELRFSDKPDNYCINLFNKKVLSIPFELWNIGVDTPNDESDDFRLIPFTRDYNDTTDSWIWNSYTSYSSNFSNSLKVYFYDVKDHTPGEAGYKIFAEGCEKSGGAGSIYNFDFDNDPGAKDYNAGDLIWGEFSFLDFTAEKIVPPPGSTVRFIIKKHFTADEELVFKSPYLDSSGFIEKFSLYQNYPNPFNPVTTFRFSIKEEAPVKLEVYNILGQKVRTIINETMKPGNYEKIFTSGNLASGVYIYRIEVNGIFTETKKMVLLK